MRALSIVPIVCLTLATAARAAAPIPITPLDANGAPVSKPGAPVAPPPAPPTRPANAGDDLLRGPIPVGPASRVVVIGGAPDAQGRLPPGAELIVLTPELCRTAVAHVPDAGVNASSITIEGDSVAPADLPQPFSAQPAVPAIEGVRVYGRPLVVAPGSPYAGAVRVGTVTVDAAGQPLLNGRPIDQDASTRLARLCDAAGMR